MELSKEQHECVLTGVGAITEYAAKHGLSVYDCMVSAHALSSFFQERAHELTARTKIADMAPKVVVPRLRLNGDVKLDS